MPYNATWIEPWMRPLKKTALRRRIPNQTASLRSKQAATSQTVSKNSRRATRKRRFPSKNWSRVLGTKF